MQRNNFGNAGCIDTSPGTTAGESLKQINLGQGFPWVVANSACGGDVLFTNARVLIFHDFALSKERLLFSSGFVTVGEDSVLENRAT